jgi:tetratricopeptide (TPR) repeat protein
MNKLFLNFFAAACIFSGVQVFGDETNSPASAPPVSMSNTDALNAYLQIQAQLHETQMMVESNREQTIAALQQGAKALNADIMLMQNAVVLQRRSEEESTEGVERTMLIVGGVGMLMLAAVVTMVWLQLRTATRLIELAMAPGSSLNRVQPSLPVVETGASEALPASARAALEFSNARLLGVIERLEKRILELEHTVRVPLNENNQADLAFNGSGSISERRIEDLIVEGQLFLDTNKPEKALHCFEEALDIQPDLGEALIKKAAALEKLERTDEAITCYDRAIDLGDSSTTALLQKGGMLNRLARYDEALQCYERALQTQEKKAVTA